MSRPFTAEAPPSSDPADQSGRLLRALLSSAGLKVRGDEPEAEAQPPAPAPTKRAGRRTPTPSR
jgi:hypothetical protein